MLTKVKPNDIQANDEGLIKKLQQEIKNLKDIINIRKKTGKIDNTEIEMLKLKEENSKLKYFFNSPTMDIEKLLQENKKLKIDIQKIKSNYFEQTENITINSPISRSNSKSNFSNLSLSSNLKGLSNNINSSSLSLSKSNIKTSETKETNDLSNSHINKPINKSATNLPPVYIPDKTQERNSYLTPSYDKPSTLRKIGESIILEGNIGTIKNKKLYNYTKSNSDKSLTDIKIKKGFFMPSERLKMFEEYEIKMTKKMEDERLNLQRNINIKSQKHKVNSLNQKSKTLLDVNKEDNHNLNVGRKINVSSREKSQ